MKRAAHFTLVALAAAVWGCGTEQTVSGPPLDVGPGLSDTAADTCSGDACAVCDGQPEKAPCDDANPCTTGDMCQAGQCVGD